MLVQEGEPGEEAIWYGFFVRERITYMEGIYSMYMLCYQLIF